MESKNLFFLIYAIGFITLTLIPFKILTFSHLIISSHHIGSGLIIFLFINNLFKTRGQILFPDPIIKKLLLSFFLIISLSVIQAINIYAFFSTYKNLLLGIIIYLVTVSLLKRNYINSIMNIVLLGCILSVFIQFTIFFSFPNSYHWLDLIIYPKYMSLLTADGLRNRYFSDFFYFATIPLLTVMVNSKINKIKRTSIVLILSLLFLAMVSNYRTVFLLTLISLSAFIKKIKFGKLFTLILLITLLIIFRGVAINLTDNSSIDRVFSNEEVDQSTIISRFKLLTESWDIGIQLPLGGVGIGNFYDYVDKKLINLSLWDWKAVRTRLTVIDPHNIFAKLFVETGFLGLIFYITLQIYFIIKDSLNYYQKGAMQRGIVQSFWILSLYTLVNPVSIVQFQILYWGLRALIDLNLKEHQQMQLSDQ